MTTTFRLRGQGTTAVVSCAASVALLALGLATIAHGQRGFGLVFVGMSLATALGALAAWLQWQAGRLIVSDDAVVLRTFRRPDRTVPRQLVAEVLRTRRATQRGPVTTHVAFVDVAGRSVLGLRGGVLSDGQLDRIVTVLGVRLADSASTPALRPDSVRSRWALPSQARARGEKQGARGMRSRH